MEKFIVIVIVLLLAVISYIIIKKIDNKKDNKDEQIVKTANDFINVKDIHNNTLHNTDNTIFACVEIQGVSMDLYSEREKIEYCNKITSIMSRINYGYKYIAISSPYVIKYMIARDSQYLATASGICKEMLIDDINFATKLVIDDNKIDRRFFIVFYTKENETEADLLKRTNEFIHNLRTEGVECALLEDKEIIKMYNLYTNPAYTVYERTDDTYMSLSQIIATNT